MSKSRRMSLSSESRSQPDTHDERTATDGCLEVTSGSGGRLFMVSQAGQLKNPDALITLVPRSSIALLAEFAICKLGLGTGDYPRYIRQFWEFLGLEEGWTRFQSAAASGHKGLGYDAVIAWDPAVNKVRGMSHAERVQAHTQDYRGREAWGREGAAVSLMTPLKVCGYLGDRFDKNVAAVIAKNPSWATAVNAFVYSSEFARLVYAVDPQLKVTNASLLKVPFDLAHWERVAAEQYPYGLPEPQSDDPTQWLFHGHPATAEPASILQVAVARLAGYRWPAELDETMRLATEARAWVDTCKKLAQFADDDGVVPIVPMRGEPAAEGRVRDLLRAAFGGEWSGAKEATLLATKNADTLDDWLKNRFFAEHCSLFHNRPFVWHIWDGRKKDGFGVLVHYHRLAAPNGEGRRLLEKITHGYLGDWISRQRDELKANKAGADARLAAALDLQKKLEAILAGEPPYDIFVRWKPLHEQPAGWEPDINDGVRMNIRPFIEAGVLRDKVNVKWTKDRGQEPQAIRPKVDFPWFWSSSAFSGDRVNDVHLSVAEKQKAREAKGVQ